MEQSEFLSLLVEILKGGALGLIAASLATHFGLRSADRLPGESRIPHCFACARCKFTNIFRCSVGCCAQRPETALPVRQA